MELSGDCTTASGGHCQPTLDLEIARARNSVILTPLSLIYLFSNVRTVGRGVYGLNTRFQSRIFPLLLSMVEPLSMFGKGRHVDPAHSRSK